LLNISPAPSEKEPPSIHVSTAEPIPYKSPKVPSRKVVPARAVPFNSPAPN